MEAAKQAIKLEDLVDLFRAREYAYDILRRFFIEEPTREYVTLFVENNLISLFPFKEESAGIMEGVEKVKAHLGEFAPHKIDRHFEDLHWDFTRLFIGPFDLPSPPWESFYVRKDQLLFQQTTMEARKLYKKYGYETAEFNVEADDHIGLELDFMYHLNALCIKSADAENANAIPEIMYLLKEQQDFIRGHLSKFVPQFTEKVIQHAETDFFRGMAEILNHYIIMDSKVLEELMNIEIIQN
ncbi:molecular chaperone TorD family protein [Bacillus sp. REN3]|uniref:TorD/DmsD family molecular chaperone n=1 Tax=Bacillus sp. REN3 TaxID=2802440 RepID=UPI001AED9288|nr:molecular chaperone TorD family protein [Bacillus sp. REN3]